MLIDSEKHFAMTADICLENVDNKHERQLSWCARDFNLETHKTKVSIRSSAVGLETWYALHRPHSAPMALDPAHICVH